MGAGTVIEGIDIYTADLTRDWLRNHPEQRVVVQNLWPGGWGNRDILRQRCPQNLYNARMEGRIICGYMAVTPDQPVQWYGHDYYDEAMAEAKLRAGDCWGELRALFSDLETFEDPPGSKNFYWPSETRAYSWTERMSLEKKTGTYTGKWFIDQYYKGKMRPEWTRYPLWVAHYGISPTLQQATGPWASLVGHQYGGDVNFDGITADHNIFDASFFQEDDMGITEEQVAALIKAAVDRLDARVDMLLGAFNIAEGDFKHMIKLSDLVMEKDYAGIRAYLDQNALGLS